MVSGFCPRHGGFTEIKGAEAGLFFKRPAEVPLVMIPNQFANLFDGQLRIMEKILSGVGHAQRSDKL